MPGGNKKVTYTKQTCSFQLQVYWSMCDFLPPGIKGLKATSANYFYHNIALKVQLVVFYTGRKKLRFFLKIDFCVFHESANFKIFNVFINIAYWKIHFLLLPFHPV